MDDMNFEVTTNDGKNIKCTVIHHFENNGNQYLFYTDNELNEDGVLNVLAAKYTLDNNILNLEEITDDKEWDLIDKEWEKYYGEE